MQVPAPGQQRPVLPGDGIRWSTRRGSALWLFTSLLLHREREQLSTKGFPSQWHRMGGNLFHLGADEVGIVAS